MVNYSQGSVTRKGFLWQVFYDGAEVDFSELSWGIYTTSRLFVRVQSVNECFMQDDLLFHHWWWPSEGSICSLNLIQLLSFSMPVTWYHEKTLCLGRHTQLCVGLCIARMLFHEQLGWRMQMKPAPAAPGRNPTLLTIWTDWCASQCGNRVLHFMHSNIKSYIYTPFLSSSAAYSSPFLICLFVFSTFAEKRFTKGQRYDHSACAAFSYCSGLYEGKTVYWVAECGGDISGHNQSNGFDVSVFLRGKGSWDPIIGSPAMLTGNDPIWGENIPNDRPWLIEKQQKHPCHFMWLLEPNSILMGLHISHGPSATVYLLQY